MNSWDAVYSRELDNYDQDGDEGTVWFSESNAEGAILRELHKLEEARLLRRTAISGENPDQPIENRTPGCARALPASRFLDLGTGNGHMLFELCDDEGERGDPWCGEMVGVDYSEPSVQLARRIAAQRFDETAASESLRFEHWDLLSSPPGDWLKDGFDVTLDKGTFDAISLMPQDSNSRHPCEVYCDKVTPLLKPGAFLIITSCNWTKEELIRWLVSNDGQLNFYGEAKYPTYAFGGQTGQSVVTVVFQRRRG